MPSEIIEEDGVEIAGEAVCSNCREPLTAGSKFCRHCGFSQISDHQEEAVQKWQDIRQILWFFIIDAVICCVAGFVKFFHTLSWSISVDCLLAVTAVVFFALNWSKYRSLLTWHNFSPAKLLGYCAIAVGASVLVSFFVDWVNHSLFSKHFSYYAFYAPYKHGAELTIFFTAVMPALFEELGYRGFLLGKLLAITEQKQAILISSFLFAIMHTSFISLVWLIPFALWQGYIRVKQNTIWYGVCTHFCFNFTVCITEIWQAGYHH